MRYGPDRQAARAFVPFRPSSGFAQTPGGRDFASVACASRATVSGAPIFAAASRAVKPFASFASGFAPLRDQELDHLHPIEHGRDHQRRASIRRCAFHVGAMFQQCLDNRLVTLERRARDRRLAVVVAQVRVRLVFEQHAHGIGVAVVAREHDQRVALVVAQVRRQAFVQQGVEHGGVAAAGYVEDLAREIDELVAQGFAGFPGVPAGESGCMGGSIGMAWTGAARPLFDAGAAGGAGSAMRLYCVAYRQLSTRRYRGRQRPRPSQFLSVRQDTQVWRQAAPG